MPLKIETETSWPRLLLHRCCFAALLPLLIASTLRAAPSPIGTGLKSNITLGALQNPAVVNQQWPDFVDYDVDPATWTYDVYVPPNYDGTKPYGVVVYITSDPTPGVVLQTASNDKNLIWIAPRNVGNNQGDYTLRFGASLLALYRAKELFNIDSRRVYTSGKSGGARIASALAFYHSEVIKGTAPSSGFGLPRLNEVSPDYITKPTLSTTPESFYNYSAGWFFGVDASAINTTAKGNKLRSYIMGRENDYREEYFVESFHCAYEPQGQTCFLYNAPGEHTDPSDAEMEEAINYLDRDDLFPVNANITAGSGGFSGLTNISQSGASAVEATSAGKTTYTLTPTLTAAAAAKTNTVFYWDSTNGSTVRWLWEVKNASPTNQKTSFGLWFANETWGGGVPTSVTAGSNPGILITITQNGSVNRMIVSARPDSGGETIFYDGNFSFVPTYSTAWTSTQTGYLTGTGSPVEMRMDLNQNRWQLTFNGIVLGTTTSIASGTRVSRDNKRSIYGYWNTAVGGSSFWKHDPFTSRSNTWSPLMKSIFTAATGALSGAGTAPSPMELRYVIASDPNLPDPPLVGPTGLAGSSSNNVINLTWNAVSGATSYTLQRSSVSGGPYTTIQSGISGTSYTDSAVTVGEIYYYTIFATTPSGDTATVAELAVGAGFRLDTWSGGGADNNWQTAANWNALPVAGDSLVFGGTTRLSNTNNFSANTSFRDLTFNSGAGAFTLGGNAITLTKDVVNNGTATQTVNLPVALTSGAHSLTTSAGTVVLGGVISGSGSLSKSGTGLATLSATNTYSGGTLVTAGELKVSMPTTTGTFTHLGTGTVTTNGGLLRFIPTSGTSNTETFANNFVFNGGTITSEDGNTVLGTSSNTLSVTGATTLQRIWGHVTGKALRLNGIISGSAALTLQGTGGAAGEGASIWINNANNSYSGTLTVNAGVGTGGFAMVAGANNALQFANLNLNGTRTSGSTDAALLYGVQFASGVTAPVLGSLAGNGNINLVDLGNNNVALDVGANAGTTTFSGILSGAGSLTKTGTGTLALAGANTHTGGTTINNGLITFTNASSFGTGTITANGGTIRLLGTNDLITTNNLVVNSATTLDIGVLKNWTFNGNISGSGDITRGTTATASLFLGGDNSGYAGTFTIQNNGNSIVRFNAASAGSGSAKWVVNQPTNSRVSLEFGAGTIKFGSLTGTGFLSGGIAAGTKTIEVGNLGLTETFSGVINENSPGVVAVTKVGNGMLTLSGTSTYSGATTINGGILNITGTLNSNSGTVAVNSGGTLAGSGTVARATTVASGGVIAPGNGGVGTLTLSAGLTLNTGAVLRVDLAGTATSDKIAVSGVFAASGTTTINLTALGSFAGSGTYPLITGATGISAGSFAVGTTPSGYVCTLGASSGTLSITARTVVENWRFTYFNTTANSGNAADSADPDGDGLTNAQEFTAGTNPTNAASLLKITSLVVSGNDYVASFPTVSGKFYRMERSDTLQAGSWTTVLDNIAGTGGTVQVTDVGAAAQNKRFYRIVTP